MDTFIILYHGAIVKNRGIEQLINLLGINSKINLVILGECKDKKYLEELKEKINTLGVETRVIFHPSVPNKDLWQYIGAVDLSVMMISSTVKSYYLSLPNKFFESIQSLTPLITSDFPEMKKIIDKYKIGLTCNPNNVNELNSCVEKMRTDRSFYLKCKNNLKIAKEDFCWEKEKRYLINAFKKYIN